MGAMAEAGFGERLKTLLEERDMTQAELARTLHLGKSTVSQYISGVRSPDLGTVRKIAEFFSVSIDYLIGRTDVRWPALLKDADVQLLIDRTGELTPAQRRRLLEFIDYLRFEERRREKPRASPETGAGRRRSGSR
ncbi:MAG TPA: hypothetical protein DGR79_03115 [Clostridiales bacterium]|nr:hypothetical protein [Clostridiales bacterium]